ncbi:MAG: hypothetical protein APZ16_04110 [Candidatus Hadarchaeum yellowstonense]|jgi:uncharacterized membrane protein (DUF485 family)|uniref:Uncharacterized protein n=1 Tax=Hadarchaeum yellowstonense TaxID=1776334 RepID=A0A147K0T1_HADYE|nr:MAG: hypothetical protein APZ16_04110 [Candidatus Hadarchaeum yellowstonense]
MAEGGRSGSTLIGLGAFLIFLGTLFFLAVYLGYLQNQTWIFPWITTYRVALGGLILGLILLAAGLYTRSAVKRYERRLEELEQARRQQEALLRAKAIELGKARAEAERKAIALKLTHARLKKARLKAEKRKQSLLRVRGKLGERSKRLKRIRKLAEV